MLSTTGSGTTIKSNGYKMADSNPSLKLKFEPRYYATGVELTPWRIDQPQGALSESADVAVGIPSGAIAVSELAASPEVSVSPEAGSESVNDEDEQVAGWLPWLFLPLSGVLGLLMLGLKGRVLPAVDEETQPDPTTSGSLETPLAESPEGTVIADRSDSSEYQVASELTPEPTLDEVTNSADNNLVESATVDSSIATGTSVPAETETGLTALGNRDRRSQIVLAPRTINQGYVYWEAPEAEKSGLRRQGGEQLTLWIGDITDLDPERQSPRDLEAYPCLETAQDQFVALPKIDRDYIAEIGYLTADGQRLILARSQPIRSSEAGEASGATIPDLAVQSLVAEESTILPTEDFALIETRVTPDNPDVEAVEAVIPAATLGLVASGTVLESLPLEEAPAQSDDEAVTDDKQSDLSREFLASIDENLPDLPVSYGESWITLLPRDPQWAYAYWDIPNYQKQAARQNGGERLALRFYDVTGVDLSQQNPQSLQQYECDEMTRDWYIPIPISDRDYIAEIGYVANDGRWLMLARSNPVRIPPLSPADWYDEQFVSIDWEDELRGKTFLELVPPQQKAKPSNSVSDQMLNLAESAQSQRVAGSIFGSMQQVPGSLTSSYGLASGSGLGIQTASGLGIISGAGYTISGGMSGIGMSGIGMSGIGMSSFSSGMNFYTPSGMGMSGVGMSGVGMYSMSGMVMSGVGMSGVGMYSMSGMGISGIGMSGVGMYSMSGMGMSGVGMSGVGMYSMSGIGMSGIGFSASMPPLRPRKFWLIADAELIVYGATEPDAKVTIAGRPVQLNSDGTFRFQMSFQDGMIDFPIMAVAADGEQTRSVHLSFNRHTVSRHTHSKEEAQDEWF